jgi:hypothetical protein
MAEAEGGGSVMPPKRIQDRFTHLNVSKQRKYQMRQQARGRCELCSSPIEKWGLCRKHLKAKQNK